MNIPRLMNKNGNALTLWFREGELSGLSSGKITSTIRFGDRRAGTADPKGGYKIGSIIKLLILNQDGDFLDFVRRASVLSVETLKMKDLQSRQFVGAPDDQSAKKNLCKVFRRYYGELLCSDELISVIKFEYLD